MSTASAVRTGQPLVDQEATKPAESPSPRIPRRLTGTLRGLIFLGCGLMSTLSGIIFGQRQLLEVGLLLLLVPAIAAGLLAVRTMPLQAHRPKHTQRSFVNQSHQFTLEVTSKDGGKHSRLRAWQTHWVVEEHLPSSMGANQRFSIDTDNPQLLSYSLRPTRRGRYKLGPLATMVTDPLGLWEMIWHLPGRTTMLVAPRLVSLPQLALYGRFPVGMSTSASVWSSEDDITVREYRYGDSQRRVHWRASARAGELMVRREEQPEQGNATVLLEDSSLAHEHGRYHSSSPNGSPRRASFELAVSVAASLVVALTTAGFGVNLRTRSGRNVGDVRVDEAAPLLDVLSEIELSPTQITDSKPSTNTVPSENTGSAAGASGPLVLPGFGAAHASSDGSGAVIAILGQSDGALLHELSSWPTRGRRALALLIDQAQPKDVPGDLALSSALAQEQLSSAGWNVLSVSSLDELAHLWMGVQPRTVTGNTSTNRSSPETEVASQAGSS